jgi:hypothetical protein
MAHRKKWWLKKNQSSSWPKQQKRIKTLLHQLITIPQKYKHAGK